ncbi:MAG: hypothetical protein JW913_07940 [Chitinispirillaceae bacterium]|nr:hypothetical protein [Chitinispirillaceae bacterium]
MYIMPANHFVTYGSQSIYGVIDNFDFYGIFRHFDALAAYTFTGDTAAKTIALGIGSKEQCFMGEWPDGTPVTPLAVSEKPQAIHPSLQYMFSWNNRLNPRRGALQTPFKKRRDKAPKR